MDLTHVPEVDARTSDSLTPADVSAFRAAGVLVARGVVRGPELDALRAETQQLVDWVTGSNPEHPDVRYAQHQLTGSRVPYRVEYVIDKKQACKVLLAHPFILRSIEVMQGKNFVPTWDSMVFKMAGEGAAIPWHRDDTVTQEDPPYGPVVNVDFYLDGSDDTNCLWALPGSNRWTRDESLAEAARRNDGGFDPEGAVPLPMEPGDVIFHSVNVMHGSPPARSGLRRVLYYEFRSGERELEFGPHTSEYIPLKQQVLEACLRHRSACTYTAGEASYAYRPDARFRDYRADEPATYRYPHGQYRRETREEY